MVASAEHQLRMFVVHAGFRVASISPSSPPTYPNNRSMPLCMSLGLKPGRFSKMCIRDSPKKHVFSATTIFFPFLAQT